MKTDAHKKKITLGVLCALCGLSVCVMIFAVIKTLNDKGAVAPSAFDPTAVMGTPDVPKDLGYSPLEVEQGYKAYVCGELLAIGSNVDVYFTSPETNAVWLLLRLTDETGAVLGETDRKSVV